MISKQLFGSHSFQFCSKPELIENYDKAINDDTQIYACHHRLETHNSDSEPRSVPLSKAELQALGMYYQRPPEELIFMTRKEHAQMHNSLNKSWEYANKANVGKPKSKETKEKIANTLKGRKCPEHSKKIKGRHWYNNGKINVMQYECPDGFVLGKLK